MIFTPRGKKDFLPFDLIDMEPEPTHTRKGVSVDAVTYYLSTFQLGEKQTLQLQIGYRGPESAEIKTLQVRSHPIRLMTRIPEAADLLDYRSDTELPVLQDPPNLALLFLYFLVAVTLLGLFIIWIQGPIESYLRIRKVELEWNKVTQEIRRLQTSTVDQRNLLNQLNRIWKIYVDPKGRHALLSLTTTELLPVIREIEEIKPKERETLIQTSHAVDEVIYAGHELPSDQLQQMSQRVSDLLSEVYQRRKAKVSYRMSYTRQFLSRIRKLWEPPQPSKTSWKGGY
jgi:hypothetical protein